MSGDAGGIRFIKRKELLAGVCAAAMAMGWCLGSPASAAEYLVSNDAELRAAIISANADGDPDARITLTGDIAVANSVLPTPGKPMTIDAQGFTLTATADLFAGTGGTVTLLGTVAGANANPAGTGQGDRGLWLGTTSPSSIINNGSIRGGAGGGTGGLGGDAAELIATTIVNNGSITGGSGSVGGGGIGAEINRGSFLTNNDIIQGGDSRDGAGGVGVHVISTLGASTLVNNGTIRGGSGGTVGGVGVLVRTGAQPIVNTGTIEGGNGAAAIQAFANANLTLTNSGTIRAGTGQANAITFVSTPTTGTITLELQEGSVIEGNVVANSTSAADLLRLGGTENDTFDVSTIGTQYQNFNIFEKRGASTWTITGQGTGQAAAWDIYEGTMLLSAGSDLGDGPVDVFGGVLAGVGTVGATTLHAGGSIAPGSNGIGTLTVDGDYTGNGGLLAVETTLGGDTSPTDLLVINGNSTGSTRVQITNLGGTGAQTQEGIKIVDVDGTSGGTFSLLGEVVVNGQQAVLGGAYAYSLYQGGITDPDDGDWYLRSLGFSPTATSYESYPGILLSLIEMPTLRQRVSERYVTVAGSKGLVNPEPAADVPDTLPPANFWTRIEAAYGHQEGQSDTGTEYDLDRYRVQVGLDGSLGESDDGMLIVGINAQYGRATADLSSDTGDGDTSTDSYGGGLSLVWLGNSGFYADAQAMAHYLESDLSSDVVGDLVDNNQGWGYGFSLEVGRKLALDNAWSVTPQAQLAYTSVDFDDFTDEQGTDVSLEKGESLKGRLGLALGYDSYESGETRAHVYTIANLTYEVLGEQSVDIAGVDVDFEPDEFGGELGLGGTYEWAGGKYALHGEALGQTSFGGSYGVKGTAGFSTRF